MSDHALAVLDFPRALEVVAGRATSEAGRDRVLSLRPRTDRDWVDRELTRVAETQVFLDGVSPWAPPSMPASNEALARLAVDGAVLDGVQVHTLGVLLASAGDLAEAMDGGEGSFPALHFLRERLSTDVELTLRIEQTVDAQGDIKDSASRDLRRIRSRLRSAHKKIVGKLEAFVRDLPERFAVSDASIGVREGRFVVPIRREGRADVGGMVHDESHTGATLFVEPPLAISLNNDLRGLEREETREVHRVLTDITAALRTYHGMLTDGRQALVDFDSLYARARTATAWGATRPALTEAHDGLHVVRGRHPILLSTAGEDVVPFDLTLDPEEHVLVVSGPNTGGKSVLLKAIGLISSLTQSGVIPPVDEGTKLPVFDSFFADIGDEQSIAENLSTFSAHLLNWKEIAEHADEGSLVLVDEMGTGTDPAEGAALARALLEHLAARCATAIVTSHLSTLKRLDTEDSGIVNASLQFDLDRLEPTYQLVKGRPGRSFGLAIARRLGLSGSLLDRAESHVSEGEASVDELLERLEKSEKEARALVVTLEREQSLATRLRAEVEARESDLKREERDAERKAREEARRFLMAARGEVEEAIRAVRDARSPGDLEEAAHAARRRVEEAARRQRTVRPDRQRPVALGLTSGERVRLLDGDLEGVVVEVRDRRAVVDASGIRMRVPLTDLVPLDSAEGRAVKPRGSASWSAPSGPISTEVDLRGLRVDEVGDPLLRSIDEAILSDLTELRIIHGKGTGAVRARVKELLEGDGRVSDFRLGRPGEGGGGVTVASFR